MGISRRGDRGKDFLFRRGDRGMGRCEERGLSHLSPTLQVPFSEQKKVLPFSPSRIPPFGVPSFLVTSQGVRPSRKLKGPKWGSREVEREMRGRRDGPLSPQLQLTSSPFPNKKSSPILPLSNSPFRCSFLPRDLSRRAPFA